ncbi:hypothetical protein EHW67_08450 [Arenibacter aquaticus]|uniref:Uncharacterized protein n=1 Tax=Arenibacter aquaticus TaxID=2489054 RepID=A0A3S0BXK8_9FLAO|nr:hypothetical protein [Arenibacter aquaticus]RTE53954.1 hypothetical protein EHW67_08450 [Arenibacter aquaticus]
MSKELVTLVFKKAEIEIGSSVKTRMAQYLADILLDDYKYPISERTLRDYYTAFVEKEEANNEELKPQLITCFCNYLGYDNYASFVTEHPFEKKELPSKRVVEVGADSKNKNRIILFSSALAFTGLSYFGFVKEEENCMVWKENHYERTACTGASLESPLKELILEEFRKIENFDSLVDRKTKGKELWYDKSNGKVEFFTYHGYHPENNKPLKSVTDHIYQTYVLDKRKDAEQIGLKD